MAQIVSRTFTHRGFNIVSNADDAVVLKNTVDDFMDSIVPMTTPDEGISRIDAERIAMAHSAACIMLMTNVHGICQGAIGAAGKGYGLLQLHKMQPDANPAKYLHREVGKNSHI